MARPARRVASITHFGKTTGSDAEGLSERRRRVISLVVSFTISARGKVGVRTQAIQIRDGEFRPPFRYILFAEKIFVPYLTLITLKSYVGVRLVFCQSESCHRVAFALTASTFNFNE